MPCIDRCLQTSKPIAERLSLPIYIEHGLIVLVWYFLISDRQVQGYRNGIPLSPRERVCFLAQRTPSNYGSCYPRSVRRGIQWKSILLGALSGSPLAKERISKAFTLGRLTFSYGLFTRSTRDRTCVTTNAYCSSRTQHRSSPCADTLLRNPSCRLELGAVHCLSFLASVMLRVSRRVLDGKRYCWPPLPI